MEFSILFYLGIIILGGLFGAKIIRMFKLPNVTGYLIAGLLIGPYVLGLVPANVTEELAIISDMALGFIAFSIGGEFKLSYFKRVGVTPIVIAILESSVAVLFVVLGLLAAGQPLPFSLVLGAIAAATAPAATVMVIKQYNSKGPVTETLLSVVAIDDACALILFGFAVAVSSGITGNADSSILTLIMSPFIEVGTSILLGGALGFVFTWLTKIFKQNSNRVALSIAFVFIAISVATVLNASALLVCMCMGAIFANLSAQSGSVFSECDNITPPIYMMFFVLSGAELNLSILPTIGVIGVIYVILRVAGKMAGAYLGAKLSHAPDKVCKFLGPALLPQAGVAIGLTFVAQTVVPHYAETIRAIVLCGTLIYEVVGPGVSKATLQKAGEIPKGV